MTRDPRRLREKLHDAAVAITDRDRPLQEALRSAYLYGLSGLESDDFPDDDGRAEFEALVGALSATGEAVEGAGSVPTTVWLMDETAVDAIRARILALVDRYGARGQDDDGG